MERQITGKEEGCFTSGFSEGCWVLSDCWVELTANNLDGELVGAKRLLEASGLGYFRVSGYPWLDHYSPRENFDALSQ